MRPGATFRKRNYQQSALEVIALLNRAQRRAMPPPARPAAQKMGDGWKEDRVGVETEDAESHQRGSQKEREHRRFCFKS